MLLSNKELFRQIEKLLIENAKRKKIEHARIARENIQRKQEENMKEIIDKKIKFIYSEKDVYQWRRLHEKGKKNR